MFCSAAIFTFLLVCHTLPIFVESKAIADVERWLNPSTSETFSKLLEETERLLEEEKKVRQSGGYTGNDWDEMMDSMERYQKPRFG